MASTHMSILSRKKEHYDREIQRHGCTAAGVGWNSQESQEMRFRQLLKLADGTVRFSINDFGCGYGALADYLRKGDYSFQYCGYDISPQMIQEARQLHWHTGEATFVNRESEMSPADFTIASGVFNDRFGTSAEEWEAYVLGTLTTLDRLSRKGFAFNMLTKYSDRELMRSELYYADPAVIFDFCKTKFSRFVTLLHDYPLYEFTILVRKNI